MGAGKGQSRRTQALYGSQESAFLEITEDKYPNLRRTLNRAQARYAITPVEDDAFAELQQLLGTKYGSRILGRALEFIDQQHKLSRRSYVRPHPAGLLLKGRKISGVDFKHADLSGLLLENVAFVNSDLRFAVFNLRQQKNLRFDRCLLKSMKVKYDPSCSKTSFRARAEAPGGIMTGADAMEYTRSVTPGTYMPLAWYLPAVDRCDEHVNKVWSFADAARKQAAFQKSVQEIVGKGKVSF